MKKLSIWIKSATFSDGTTIEFKNNDLIVFVGPNNAGKSEALKDIERKSTQAEYIGTVIKELTIEYIGNETDLINWLESNCHKGPNKIVRTEEYSRLEASIPKHLVTNRWKGKAGGLSELRDFFIYRLTTQTRLEISDPPENIALTQDTLTHPIHYMQRDPNIESEISNYFRKAFDQDLIIHRNAGKIVPLHCGNKPIPKEGQDKTSIEYSQALEKLPTLKDQGDGMRAFVGILLLFIINHEVVLIDEPDLFLHPPQAHILGQMLAKQTLEGKQIFTSTHSGDFLRGLLDSNTQQVRIIRIRREGNTNIVRELNSEGIKNVWGDSLLKHSNILDGVFHEKVIICESDSDCQFYTAIYDATTNKHNIRRKDVMFIHCGGKDRIPTIVKSLHALGVPVSVIADFDVLNSDKVLQLIYGIHGSNWNDVDADWKLVRRSISDKRPKFNSNEIRREIETILSRVSTNLFPTESKKEIEETLRMYSPWSEAKKNGRSYVPNGDPSAAYNRLSKKLEEQGIFIVEVGELEGFVKDIGNHGPSWVNTVLETKDIANDPDLEPARAFVMKVIG